MSDKLFNSILLVIAIFKIWLIAGFGFAVYADAGHDDGLFYHVSKALLEWLRILPGNANSVGWLGDYNHVTLIKMPGYPLWLSTNFILGLPLSLSQQLLYVFSGLVLITAIRPSISNKYVLIALFLACLLIPLVTIRIVREGIYPALTLLTLAGFLGLCLRHDAPWFKMLGWSLLSGVALGGLWLTREEGIWILPSVCLLIGYLVFLIYKKHGVSRLLVNRILLSLLPLIILLSMINAVSWLNFKYYGIYSLTETQSAPFKNAFGALLRVQQTEPRPFVAIPKKVRMQLYEVSPAFAELREILEHPDNAWRQPGRRLGVHNDFYTGWFLWAFRDAAALRGHHANAQNAAIYYERIANEIDQACVNGRLICSPHNATTLPPLSFQDMERVIVSLWQGILKLSMFDGKYVSGLQRNLSLKSMGKTERLEGIGKFINDDFIPPPSTVKMQMFLQGWVFSKLGQKLDLQIQDTQGGKVSNLEIKRFDSPDVFEHFKKLGKNYPTAMKARFIIKARCPNQCELSVYSGEQLFLRASEDKQDLLSEDIHIHVSKYLLENISQKPPEKRLTSVRKEILRNVATIYQFLLPYLSLASLALYFITTGYSLLLKRQINFLWVVNTAILGAIFSRLLILAIIDATMFPAINYLYLSPLYPLLFIFIILVMVDTYRNFHFHLTERYNFIK